MGDLRESSQLENDAHVIALLHREWDENEGRLSWEGELIVAKQRRAGLARCQLPSTAYRLRLKSGLFRFRRQ
jgi:replicative DNA helicase